MIILEVYPAFNRRTLNELSTIFTKRLVYQNIPWKWNFVKVEANATPMISELYVSDTRYICTVLKEDTN